MAAVFPAGIVIVAAVFPAGIVIVAAVFPGRFMFMVFVSCRGCVVVAAVFFLAGRRQQGKGRDRAENQEPRSEGCIGGVFHGYSPSVGVLVVSFRPVSPIVSRRLPMIPSTVATAMWYAARVWRYCFLTDTSVR